MAEVQRKRERDTGDSIPVNDGHMPNSRQPRLHVVVDNTKSDTRTRNAEVIRSKTPGVSEDFDAAQQSRTTRAALSQSNLNQRDDSSRQPPQRRITRADITRSAQGWQNERPDTKYNSVSGEYRNIQNTRTTRSQLKNERPQNKTQKTPIQNTSIAATQTAQMQTTQKMVAQKAPNQNKALTGNGNPIQKLVARSELLSAKFVAGIATPFLIITYILFLIGLFFAAQTFADAVKLLVSEVSNAENASQLFLSLALGTVNLGVVAVVGLTELVSEFNFAAALVFIAYILGAGAGVGIMSVMLIIYAITPGVHPLWGKRAAVKWMLFIATFLLHALPIAFFAPWFLIWAWYVARHPA